MVGPPETSLPGSRSALDPERAIKPGRHGLPPETVAGIQRDRLIDAFVQVVAERGYARTTIAGVTASAGVTKKAFYDHFQELDDCFLAAYARGTDVVLEHLKEAFHGEADWVGGVRSALGALLELLAGAPTFARASLVEVNAAGPRVRHARIAYLQRFRDFFLEAGVGGGPVPTAVVDAIVGGVYSVIYVRVESGATQTLPSLLPELTYFTLLPLIGREEAARYLEESTK